MDHTLKPVLQGTLPLCSIFRSIKHKKCSCHILEMPGLQAPEGNILALTV